MTALQTVFGRWGYVATSVIAGLFVFVIAAWLPNLRLLWQLWSDSSVSLADKISFPIRLLESIGTNFTVLSASYTIAIAVLVGLNVALVLYILRKQKRQLSRSGIATGTLGILSGAVGMGCAACGSLIVASLLATAGGAGFLAALPLQGGEFGVLGVLLLGAATYSLTRHIAKPVVCDVNL